MLVLCACGTTHPKGDEQYLTFMERGGRAYESGRAASAEADYQAAFMRALAAGNGLDAGNAAYNLAMIKALEGQQEEALLILHSGMDAVRAAEGDVTWDMFLLEAKILHALNRCREAQQTAEQALKAPGAEGGENSIKLCMAQIQWSLGQQELCSKLLDELMKNKTLSPVLAAGCYQLRGDMGLKGGMAVDAGSDYAQAAKRYQSAGDFEEMAEMMWKASMAYEKGGSWSEAGNWACAAASAFYGQQKVPAALRAVEQALRLAERSENAGLAEQAENLFELIKQRVPETKEEQP